MKRRLFLSTAVIGTAALGMAVYLAGSQPRYQGKTAGAWALQRYSPNLDVRDQATQALSQMGSNAAPALASLLLISTNSPASEILFYRLVPRLPPKARSYLCEKYYPINPLSKRILAAQGLEIIGPAGRAAAPALVRTLADPSDVLSGTAGHALEEMGKDAVAPLLHGAQPGNCPEQRRAAFIVLGRIGPEAREAVPALLAAQHDPDSRVSTAALNALAKINASFTPSGMALAPR